MNENPWLDRRVIAYAHQGGAHEAPSSTVFAIEKAVAARVPAIELDVHATADRVIVACHDPTLDRTTNGSGEIREHTFDELRELDNAFYFVGGSDVEPGLPESSYPLRDRAPADATLRIASLAEVLERFPGVVLNLDIKRTAPEVEPYERLLADLLREHGRGDDVIVASFNDLATQTFSAYAPEFATSAGMAATAEFFGSVRSGEPAPASVANHVALQVPATFNDIVVVDEAFVEAAHRAQLAVHVWTINDRAEMDQLLGTGADGIMTDVPSVLQELLDGRQMAWRP